MLFVKKPIRPTLGCHIYSVASTSSIRIGVSKRTSNEIEVGESSDIVKSLATLLEKLNLKRHYTGKLPTFNETDYTFSKRQMQFYFSAKSFVLWQLIQNEYDPDSTFNPWMEDQKKKAKLNAQAVSILYEALSSSKFTHISHCDIAFQNIEKSIHHI